MCTLRTCTTVRVLYALRTWHTCVQHTLAYRYSITCTTGIHMNVCSTSISSKTYTLTYYTLVFIFSVPVYQYQEYSSTCTFYVVPYLYRLTRNLFCNLFFLLRYPSSSLLCFISQHVRRMKTTQLFSTTFLLFLQRWIGHRCAFTPNGCVASIVQ